MRSRRHCVKKGSRSRSRSLTWVTFTEKVSFMTSFKARLALKTGPSPRRDATDADGWHSFGVCSTSSLDPGHGICHLESNLLLNLEGESSARVTPSHHRSRTHRSSDHLHLGGATGQSSNFTRCLTCISQNRINISFQYLDNVLVDRVR